MADHLHTYFSNVQDPTIQLLLSGPPWLNEDDKEADKVSKPSWREWPLLWQHVQGAIKFILYLCDILLKILFHNDSGWLIRSENAFCQAISG